MLMCVGSYNFRSLNFDFCPVLALWYRYVVCLPSNTELMVFRRQRLLLLSEPKSELLFVLLVC